jgi:hypothetical protein
MFCWWVERWVEDPQKQRAPYLGAQLSYMAEEVSAIYLNQRKST